ncbi:AcrR family transcriptional regulator [Pedobacter sp. UYEF25]
MAEADKKKEQIIEGAIKRFSHFGINKTTMNDIADDLSVSKPSLYYYFPDKKSLIIGVIQKVFKDYFAMLRKNINEEDTLESALFGSIDVRNCFFEKYFMLKISEGVPDLLWDDDVKESLDALKKKECDLFEGIFKNAQLKGEIHENNMQQLASLYLESLMGLTNMCVMAEHKKIMPEKKMLKDVADKQKALSAIFARGLKC